MNRTRPDLPKRISADLASPLHPVTIPTCELIGRLGRYHALVAMTQDSTISKLGELIASGVPVYPDDPCPHPVMSEAEIEEVENEIGFRIPHLLRRIYKEIGNGWYTDRSELILSLIHI